MSTRAVPAKKAKRAPETPQREIAVAYSQIVTRQNSASVPAQQKSKPTRKLPDIPSPSEQADLVLENMESAVRIAWSMLNRWRVRLPSDEVQSVTGVALCEAASRFDRRLGVAFRTFFFYHLRGLLLREISARIKDSRSKTIIEDIEHHVMQQDNESFVGWPVSLIDVQTPEKRVAEEEISKLTWEACQALDELERDIIVRFFVYDETVADIAKALGYCRCHVSRVKSRALNYLSRRLQPVLSEANESTLRTVIRTESTIERLRKPAYRGGRGRRRTGETSETSTLAAVNSR